MALALFPAPCLAGGGIDFESFDLEGEEFVILPSSVIFRDVDGTGVDVTLRAQSELRVYDLLRFAEDPTKSDQALIDWSWTGPTAGGGKTTIAFSRPVMELNLEVGDWGSDSDSPLELVAYDEFGGLIAADSADWGLGWLPPFTSLGVRAAGIRSVTFSSGGANPNSVFIDNLSFEPEPAPIPATIGNALRGLKTADSVLLAWPFVAEAASFNLYRGTLKGSWPTEPHRSGLLGTTELLPDLEGDGGLVLYRVRAVNFDGEEGL